MSGPVRPTFDLGGHEPGDLLGLGRNELRYLLRLVGQDLLARAEDPDHVPRADIERALTFLLAVDRYPHGGPRPADEAA